MSKFVFENLDKNFELINLSQEINSNMPNYIVTRVANLIKQQNKKLINSSILIVGASYKANISDTRESPIIKIAEYFLENKVNFIIHDTNVSEINIGSKILEIENTLPNNLSIFDLILILQHNSDLDIQKIINSGVRILDTRGKIQEAERL